MRWCTTSESFYTYDIVYGAIHLFSKGERHFFTTQGDFLMLPEGCTPQEHNFYIDLPDLRWVPFDNFLWSGVTTNKRWWKGGRKAHKALIDCWSRLFGGPPFFPRLSFAVFAFTPLRHRNYFSICFCFAFFFSFPRIQNPHLQLVDCHDYHHRSVMAQPASLALFPFPSISAPSLLLFRSLITSHAFRLQTWIK